MNVLFLEDEVELNAIGVEQLRKLGHTVYPALDISEARAIVEENWQTLHLIIADHRLPDGRGIDYLMEIKQMYPRIKLAVVSGCLTTEDEETLAVAEIPYFRKPLLYRQVMQKLREHYMMPTRQPFSGGTQSPVPPTPPSPGGVKRPRPPGASRPPVKPTAANGGHGLLPVEEVQDPPPKPKGKGLTSMLFSKLTKRD